MILPSSWKVSQQLIPRNNFKLKDGLLYYKKAPSIADDSEGQSEWKICVRSSEEKLKILESCHAGVWGMLHLESGFVTTVTITCIYAKTLGLVLLVNSRGTFARRNNFATTTTHWWADQVQFYRLTVRIIKHTSGYIRSQCHYFTLSATKGSK